MIDITKLKPSELIRVALDDLGKVEESDQYAVDMWVWHQPNKLSKIYGGAACSVCLAGAVMVGSLESEIENELDPDDFGYGTKRVLEALDTLRTGAIDDAFSWLRIPVDEKLRVSVVITDYDDDPAAFRQDMMFLAMYLEAHGY